MAKIKKEEATWDKIIYVATFNFFIHIQDGKSISYVVRKLHNNYSYFFNVGKQFEKMGLIVFPYRNKKNKSSIVNLTEKGKLIQGYLKNIQFNIGTKDLDDCTMKFRKRFENIDNKIKILFPKVKNEEKNEIKNEEKNETKNEKK